MRAPVGRGTSEIGEWICGWFCPCARARASKFTKQYELGAIMIRTRSVAWFFYLLASTSAFAQFPQDSGVRGGVQNTAGYLQYRGIPIPHPPLISPHPTTGATVNPNEHKSFLEGISRAGQLEATCDTCSDVTPGSPVTGLGELDPNFPQVHTINPSISRFIFL